MALREILIYPDPRLKHKAKPVAEVDASIRKLCDDLAETMYEANGVGLAAPQIGVPQNVIAIDVEQRASADGEPPKKKGEGLFWLINPVLRVSSPTPRVASPSRTSTRKSPGSAASWWSSSAGTASSTVWRRATTSYPSASSTRWTTCKASSSSTTLARSSASSSGAG